MHPVQILDEEMERLRIADKTKKYGHLETWKELYMFQRTIADPVQIQEIAEYSKMKRDGVRITLPLKDCKALIK